MNRDSNSNLAFPRLLITAAILCTLLAAPSGSGGAAAVINPALPAIASPITTFPFTENFDTTPTWQLPAGWTGINNGDPNVLWITDNFKPRSSPNAARIWFDDVNPLDDWFVSPPLQFTVGKVYQVEFYYCESNAPFYDNLSISVGTAATTAGMTAGKVLWSGSVNQANYLKSNAAAFSPDTSGVYYIGWHANSLTGRNGIVVDDIRVSEIDATVSSFPYSENFDGVTAPFLPNGWRVANGAANTVQWANTDSSLAPSQPNALKLNADTLNARDDWFSGPPMVLKANSTYKLEFFYYVLASAGKLEVKYAADPSIATMSSGAVKIWDNGTLSGMNTAEVYFTPRANGTYFLGWHAYSPAGTNMLYVDDIRITSKYHQFMPYAKK